MKYAKTWKYTRNPVILNADMTFMHYFCDGNATAVVSGATERDIFAMVPQCGRNNDCSRHNQGKLLNKVKLSV
jgi:hypothetical protein